MKKLLLTALAVLTTVSTSLGIPAYRGINRVQQPDGSYVSIRLHGDEYRHFRTTEDGYTIVRNSQGYYVYAVTDADGQLQPTTQVAHEVALRQSDEQAFLATIQKMLIPAMTEKAAEEQQAETKRRAQARNRYQAKQYDYTKFRGLILLIEYNDRKFLYDNYQQLMDSMVNQENYTGNDTTNVKLGYSYSVSGKCTGSVRDFYRDSSAGLFVPEFDVIGPITVNRSQYYAKKADNAAQLIYDAVNAANPVVDFSKYDGDGDGVVDMVYFIFAGMGSNYGEDDRLLWPHASYIVTPGSWGEVKKDGVSMGRYACGTELYGTSKWNTLAGIGTICHEFGHVLGLPDFYDTDYEKSGGESKHPGEWSVMAGGGYTNYGRTPGVYTLFERYALGWATPQVINGEGHYTLNSLDEVNTGYRINTKQKKEFFLLENRQQVKWNEYLPGHGMLVFRVDSTNSWVWENNTINCNPEHNYFEMVRAGGISAMAQSLEQPSDPFPGTLGVRTLNNVTKPANLMSWSGKPAEWGLENIRETNDGVITFTIVDANTLTGLSLPKTAVIGMNSSMHLNETRTPDYVPVQLTWTSSAPEVCSVNQDGIITGNSVGTAVITVKDSGKNRLSAQCQVTVEEWPIANDIAVFKAQEEGSEALLKLTNAQVLYVHKNNIYLRDASSCIILSDMDFALERHNIVNGYIYGQYAINDQIPMMKPIEGRTNSDGLTVSIGKSATPRHLHVSELTENDLTDYVTLDKARLVQQTGIGVFAVSGSHQAMIYNVLGAKLSYSPKPPYDNYRFNISGIVTNRKVGENTYLTISPLSIAQTIADNYTISYEVGEGGSLSNGSTMLKGNGQLSVLNDDDLYLTATPDEGYETEQLLVDGMPIDGTTIELSAILANHTVSVSFKAASGIDNILKGQENGQASIYTPDGRLVATMSSKALAHSLQHLPAGLYIIKSGHKTWKIRL